MPTLGDDEVASILIWVYDQTDRKSCSLVSKQWLRVEGLTRLSIRVLEPDSLPNFLPRFPNLLTFESSSKPLTDTQLNFISKTCPKLQYLNLSSKSSNLHTDADESYDFGNVGLCEIANGCFDLIRVFLRRRSNIGNVGVVNLVNNAFKLTTLDLSRCVLVDDTSLKAISSLNFISVLNLEACFMITDCGLEFLANGSSSRTLKRLNISECDRITDRGVSDLPRLICLEELNLAECGPKVTDVGGLAVASILSLRRLNLSWLINVSDVSIVAIAENCRGLVWLDLTGCELVTGNGVCVFGRHDCLESLTLASCYNVCGNAVNAVLNCKSLSRIVLDKGLRMWISEDLQQNIGSSCQLLWRR